MLKQKVKDSQSYQEYREMINQLMAEGKTTGANHSEAMLHYTKMNVHRMDRLDKRTDLIPELEAEVEKLDKKYIFLALTEAWCGDAAQNLPVFQKLAEQYVNFELRLVLRDENLDLMDQYLTNGGRSIPKVVVLDAETLEEVATWGPRPAVPQRMVEEYKKLEDKPPYQEFTKDLQLWYAKDKTVSTQKELVALIKELESVPA